MPTLSTLHPGRRPTFRVLLVYRVSRDVAASVLPGGLRPRLVQGYGVLTLCYTRMGGSRARFLPPRLGGTHHLSYRVAAEREDDGTARTWIVRRATSSRLDASWNETVLRREHGRARFAVERSAGGVRLMARSARGEELYLSAAAPAEGRGLFSTGQALEAFLRSEGDVRPHDVLAPMADRLSQGTRFTCEPLSVLELRASFLADLFPEPPVLDGAWRLVDTCALPLREPSVPRGSLLLAAESSRAVPAL